MSAIISLSKSSPRPSEVPLTQIPLSAKFFHVLKPLVQITLFDLILDLSGIRNLRKIIKSINSDDIFHVFTLKSGLLLAFANLFKNNKTKNILTVTGLGYAICASELILGPLVPSNTARGGGIIAPIVDSISRSLGSEPQKDPEIAGEYLHLVGAHANLITAAMFLTGMAANPIISII